MRRLYILCTETGQSHARRVLGRREPVPVFSVLPENKLSDSISETGPVTAIRYTYADGARSETRLYRFSRFPLVPFTARPLSERALYAPRCRPPDGPRRSRRPVRNVRRVRPDNFSFMTSAVRAAYAAERRKTSFLLNSLTAASDWLDAKFRRLRVDLVERRHVRTATFHASRLHEPPTGRRKNVSLRFRIRRVRRKGRRISSGPLLLSVFRSDVAFSTYRPSSAATRAARRRPDGRPALARRRSHAFSASRRVRAPPHAVLATLTPTVRTLSDVPFTCRLTARRRLTSTDSR